MKNRVLVEDSFRKAAKPLIKRYPSFPMDLLALVEDLEVNALIGVSLGGNLRKYVSLSAAKEKAKEAVTALSHIHI